MKMGNQLKKGLIILAGIAMLSMSLAAKEMVTYPKDNKATQALGFVKLEIHLVFLQVLKGILSILIQGESLLNVFLVQ